MSIVGKEKIFASLGLNSKDFKIIGKTYENLKLKHLKTNKIIDVRY